MKALALAVAVAAGIVCSAGRVDAQFRSRGSYSYVAPRYVAPAYSYPGVVNSGYYSPYSGSGVVVTSGYTPTYSSSLYPSAIYPSAFYSSTPYPSSYYSSYPSYGSGIYVAPRGRGWRW